MREVTVERKRGAMVLVTCSGGTMAMVTVVMGCVHAKRCASAC